MTIKEQIEIARLIASGTPREVAISEAKVTSSAGRTGAAAATSDKPSALEMARARLQAAKENKIIS